MYDALKSRGMDLVTITDHDSIDAAEELRGRPDFFVSEEVSCVTPSGTKLHVGVYDIDDRNRAELQRRQNDMESFLAYVQQQNLFFSVNHVFSALTGRRAAADFELFERFFPAFEIRNGQVIAASNAAAVALAQGSDKVGVAGG